MVRRMSQGFAGVLAVAPAGKVMHLSAGSAATRPAA